MTHKAIHHTRPFGGNDADKIQDPFPVSNLGRRIRWLALHES